MKTFGRNLIPEVHFHPVNPINRDLFLVITTSLLVAMALATFGVMLASQF
jgi:hypothetical protein